MEAMLAPPQSAPPGLQKASLYVGDLDPGVSESELLQAFSVGPISSVRLCRDSSSGKSLCYAYVNFMSHFDAYKALHSLNHTNLNGKPMRIMWSQRDPLARKTGIGNVFVKNLNFSVTSKDLEDIFISYGTVLSCKVAEVNGNSKGFGFVQFDSEESANAAIKALNGFEISGNKMYVCKFVRKNERQVTYVEPKCTCLYVKNLDQDLTQELLQDKFSKFGNIRYVYIVKDDKGKSKGFGFINFELPEDAEKALESMNGSELGSKKIFVGMAQKKAEREQQSRNEQIKNFKDSNVYVKNLDESIDDKMLEEHFNSFGQITSTKVMRHGNGESKGFGFVCFSTPNEANKAIAALHQTTFRGKTIYVAVAQRKEDRAVKLQPLHSQYPLQFMSSPVLDVSAASEYMRPGVKLCDPRPFYPYVPTNAGPLPPVMYPHVGMNCPSLTSETQPHGYQTNMPMISSTKVQQWLKNDFGPYAPYFNYPLQSKYALQGLKPRKSMTRSSAYDLKEIDPAVIDSREKILPKNKWKKFTGLSYHASHTSYEGPVQIIRQEHKQMLK